MSLDGAANTSSLSSWGTHKAGGAKRLRGNQRISSVNASSTSSQVKTKLSAEDDTEREDERGQRHFDLSEREAILHFAKLRGVLNLALQSDIAYRFDFNEETKLFELINAESNEWVMSFTPVELQTLMQQMRRPGGFLTDQVG